MSEVKLREVADFLSGGTPNRSKATYWNGDIPWVSPKDMKSRFITSAQEWVTEAGVSQSATRLIPGDSVLVVTRSGILARQLPVAIAGRPVAFNQDIRGIVARERLEARYLAWFLQSQEQHVLSEGVKKGATVHSLKSGFLESLLIPIPPLPEQRRIADRLDEAMAEVSTARTLVGRQVEDCTRLQFALIEEAMGGRAVATDDLADQKGDGWVALTHAARLESGHTPSRRRPEWWGGDVPWMALPDIRELDGRTAEKTSEMTNELGLANSSARLLPEGTVVLSRTASVGFVTVMGRPMATSQDFVNWVPGPMLRTWYLAYALIGARSYLRGLASGAVHKTIYMPTLKGLYIRLPSLREQDRIVDRIRSAQASASEASKSIDAQAAALDALPATLLSAAFRGEL